MKFLLFALIGIVAAEDRSMAPRKTVSFDETVKIETKSREAGDRILRSLNGKVVKIQNDEMSVPDVKRETITSSKKFSYFKTHSIEKAMGRAEAAQPDLKWHSAEDGNIVSCETFRKKAGPDYPNVLPESKFKNWWIQHKVEKCDDGSRITYVSSKCNKNGQKPCSASVCCTEAMAVSKDNSKGAQRKRNMLKMLCKLRAEQKYAEILEHWRVKQQHGVLKTKCDDEWVSKQDSFCYEMDRLAAVRDWCQSSKKFDAKWTEAARVQCAEYNAKRNANKGDLDTIRKEKALIAKLLQKLRQLIAVKPQEAGELMLAEIDAVKSLLSDKNQAMIEESRAHKGYTDEIEKLLRNLWMNLNKEEKSLQDNERKLAIWCEYKTYIHHRAHVNYMLCKNKEKIHVGIEKDAKMKSERAKGFCEDQIKVYKSTTKQYKDTFTVFTKETEMIAHLHGNIIGWVKGEQKEYKCKK